MDNFGFWRVLLYRESKVTKQIMISLIVTELDSSPDADKKAMPSPEQLTELQEEIK